MALSKNFLQMVQAQQVPQKQAYPTTANTQTMMRGSDLGAALVGGMTDLFGTNTNNAIGPGVASIDASAASALAGDPNQRALLSNALATTLGIDPNSAPWMEQTGYGDNYGFGINQSKLDQALKDKFGTSNVVAEWNHGGGLEGAKIYADTGNGYSLAQDLTGKLGTDSNQGAGLAIAGVLAPFVAGGGLTQMFNPYGSANALSGMGTGGSMGAQAIEQAAASGLPATLPQAGSIGGLLTGGGVDIAGQAGQMAGQMTSNGLTMGDTALGQSAYNFAPGAEAGSLGTVGGLAGGEMAPGIAAGAGDLTGGLLAAGSAAGNVGALDKLAATLGVSKSSLLSLGANAVNGLLGVYASSQAANAQEEAAQKAIDLQKYMYDTTRSDFAPWRETGTWALGQSKNLLQDPSSVTNDPGYQFQLNEGRKALEGSASAHGGLYSGATLKALDRYGTDYATTKFDNVLNRYNALSGSGQTATSGTANAGANYANNAGNAMMGAGNARGSAYIGGANAISGALGNWLNNYNQENMLNRIFPKP